MYGYFLLLLCFIEIPVFNAKSADHDKTMRPVAFDLGLHCLPNYPFGGFPARMGQMPKHFWHGFVYFSKNIDKIL